MHEFSWTRCKWLLWSDDRWSRVSGSTLQGIETFEYQQFPWSKFQQFIHFKPFRYQRIIVDSGNVDAYMRHR